MPPSRKVEIANDLRRRLREHEWEPGEVLPRMEDLARHYAAARGTVAEAVKALEQEGLLKSIPRKGTEVLPPRERRRIARGRWVSRRRPKEGGYSFGATQPGDPTWIHHVDPFMGELPIPPRAAELLAVEPGTPVFCRRRVTSPPGEPPFALTFSWIPPHIVEAAPKVQEQGVPGRYLDWIEMAGHGPLTWYELTRTRMPDKQEANFLRIATNLPILEISRVAESALTGTPADVSMMIIPGDRVEVISAVERDASASWPVEWPLSNPGGSYKEL
ncbi:GntR family transcriptional regulator [Spirillospora sp. CA-255316]